MDFIQTLLPTIEHFHMIGYWIAFFATLMETIVGIGLFIPGSIIVLVMGALSASGYFDLGDLFWFAIIGAIIGDNINYYIGKKYGSKIFIRGLWFIKPFYFRKGEKFFKHYGLKSVLFGRFIPSIKEVIPLVAGASNINRLSFVTRNILGIIGWSLIWILPGYFFVQSLNFVKVWLNRAGFFFLTLIVIFTIFYILKVILIKRGKKLFSFLFSVGRSMKHSMIESQKFQNFIQDHQSLVKFIQKRLNKDSFSGLPLTLFSLALIYTISLFGGIVEDVINSDIVASADIRVDNLLAIFRNTELTNFFLWVTLLGKWQIILIFTIAAIAILWLWKKQFYIGPLLLSIVGSGLFTFMGKLAFHRSRPNVAIYPENSFSFPSGHATIAVAFYGFITYLLIRNTRRWKYKINIFFAGFIGILLIGFSRLYLGLHYVSDVWGGYLVGGIWLIIAMSFSEYFLYKKRKINLSQLNIKSQLTVIIILVSIGFYLFFCFNYRMPILTKFQRVNPIITVNSIGNTLNANQLKYTETLLGNKQEPLSFIIITKNDKELINLFKRAGWNLADKISVYSITKSAKAALWKESYAKAPITPVFWDTVVHNFGFEKATSSNNIRTRHHARFWKTRYITESGNFIYVGKASFDSGIKWGVTHKINPNIDAEREFLFNELQKTGMLSSVKKEQFVKPKVGSNFLGDSFFTDGKLYLISVK